MRPHNNDTPTGFLNGNPYLKEYVRLLISLHQLIAEGEGDGEAADEIREKMDVPWRFLSGEDVRAVRLLSEDLHSTADPPGTIDAQGPSTSAAEFWAELQAAGRNKHYAKVLSLLRENPQILSPGHTAFRRGLCYLRLEEPEAAVLFFQRAFALSPRNADYALFLLIALWTERRIEDALKLAFDLTNRNDLPVHIRAAVANVLISCTEKKSGHDAASVLSRAERVLVQLVSSVEPRSHRRLFVDTVYMSLAECRIRQGSEHLALQTLSEAIELHPDYDWPYIVRGLLLYEKDPSEALFAFRKAVELNTEEIWPYYYLAAESLANKRFPEALALCEEGLALTAEPKLLAKLHEWTAIAQAELHEDCAEARSNFERALALAPEDERLRKNNELFEAGVISGGHRPTAWILGVDISAQQIRRAAALRRVEDTLRKRSHDPPLAA